MADAVQVADGEFRLTRGSEWTATVSLRPGKRTGSSPGGVAAAPPSDTSDSVLDTLDKQIIELEAELEIAKRTYGERHSVIRTLGTRLTTARRQRAERARVLVATTDFPSDAGSPQYNGKTYQQWLQTFRVERNPEILVPGVSALITLGARERPREVATALLAVMGIYDDVIDSQPAGQLEQACVSEFGRLDSVEAAAELLKTVAEGDTPRALFAYRVLLGTWSHPGAVPDRVAEDGRHLQAWKDSYPLITHVPELQDEILALTEHSDPVVRCRGITLAATYGFGDGGTKDRLRQMQRIGEGLQDDDLTVVATTARHLVATKPDTKTATDGVLRALRDGSPRARSIAIASVSKLEGESADRAAGLLIELLGDHAWGVIRGDRFAMPPRILAIDHLGAQAAAGRLGLYADKARDRMLELAGDPQFETPVWSRLSGGGGGFGGGFGTGTSSRHAAVRTLNAFNDPERAVAVLIQILQEAPRAAPASPGPAGYSEAAPDLRIIALQVLTDMESDGKAALPYIQELRSNKDRNIHLMARAAESAVTRRPSGRRSQKPNPTPPEAPRDEENDESTNKENDQAAVPALFDGKSFNEWAGMLNERNPERVATVIRALGTLADEPHAATTVQHILRALQPHLPGINEVVRHHPEQRSNLEAHAFDALQKAVRWQGGVDSLFQWLESGNSATREYILTNVIGGTANRVAWRIAETHTKHLLSPVLKAAHDGDPAVVYLALGAAVRLDEKSDELAATLQNLMQRDDEELARIACGLLVELQPETEGLVERLLELVASADPTTQGTALMRLSELKQHGATAGEHVARLITAPRVDEYVTVKSPRAALGLTEKPPWVLPSRRAVAMNAAGEVGAPANILEPQLIALIAKLRAELKSEHESGGKLPEPDVLLSETTGIAILLRQYGQDFAAIVEPARQLQIELRQVRDKQRYDRFFSQTDQLLSEGIAAVEGKFEQPE